VNKKKSVKKKSSVKNTTAKSPSIDDLLRDAIAEKLFENFWNEGQLIELNNDQFLVFGKHEFTKCCAVSAREITDAVFAGFDIKKG
jgi:hypothetical protein